MKCAYKYNISTYYVALWSPGTYEMLSKKCLILKFLHMVYGCSEQSWYFPPNYDNNQHPGWKRVFNCPALTYINAPPLLWLPPEFLPQPLALSSIVMCHKTFPLQCRKHLLCRSKSLNFFIIFYRRFPGRRQSSALAWSCSGLRLIMYSHFCLQLPHCHTLLLQH